MKSYLWGPKNRFHWFLPFGALQLECRSDTQSAFPGRGTKILRVQGKLIKTFTKLYDGLVDNLRTKLQLICSGKAVAKPLHTITL